MEKSLEETYLAMDATAQSLVLARLSHELTLVLRAHYSDYPSEPFKSIVRGENELMHSLTGHVRDLLTASTTYPEEVFLRIVREKAERAGLSHFFSIAFSRAIERAF
jgi:hypothetical protein